jgi:negative regulator of sigma E activity
LGIRYSKVAILALSVSLVHGAPPDGEEASADQRRVIDGMIRAQAARFEQFESYTRLQHYSVTTDRFGLKADMVARIHRDRLKGKTYEVLRRSGSPVIQSHVFDALLEAEVATNQQGGELLTLENYSFRLIGREAFAGRSCYLLASEPKRKDKRLLKGRIWVDAEDFGIVHIEGRPSDSLSFWVGRPMIVQDFTKQSGFWWASMRRSYIDNVFLGKSDLTVEYTDYQFEPRR